jgi:hypothetical protein
MEDCARILPAGVIISKRNTYKVYWFDYTIKDGIINYYLSSPGNARWSICKRS